MKRYLDQFNQLKPGERRVVVVVGLVTFIVLQWFFVWPYRNDLNALSVRMDKAQKDLAKFRAEIAKGAKIKTAIEALKSAGGMDVATEDQQIDFDRTWHARATENRVLVISSGRPATHTNQFFIEQELTAQVQADETNMVNFLYSLGAGNSLTRVRAISLRPDPPQYKLNCSVTIVASYQKNSPPPRSTVPVKTAAVTPTAQSEKPKPTTVMPPVKTGPTNRLPPGAKVNPATNRLAVPTVNRPRP